MARILIIDDNASDRELLREWLEDKSHHVTEMDCPEQALEELSQSPQQRYNVVLLDNRMPKMHGLDLLRKIHQQFRIHVPVILITGHGGIDDAIAADVLGAHEYFTKPDNLGDVELLDSRLWPKIESALLLDDLSNVDVAFRGDHSERDESTLELVGETLRDQISRRIGDAARHNYPVLIEGETGTGKELIARAIFRHSDRAGGPFRKVWCEQFRDPQLLASKLFGQRSDSTLGLDRPQIGEIEQANGGVLLLDDIDAIQCPSIQNRLIQLFEEGTIRREWSLEQIKVDVRILATAHPGRLAEAIEKGTLSEKLFNRLRALHVPPLRERGGDIKQLAMHFLKQSSVARQRGVVELHPQTIKKLQNYSWPSNVWELQEIIRDAILICQGPTIMPGDLSLDLSRDSREREIASFLRRAIRTAITSDASNLSSVLQSLLERELVQVAWSESNADLEATAQRVGEPASEIAAILCSLGYDVHPEQDEGKHEARPSTEKKPLSPSRKKAYQAYKLALEQCPDLAEATDEEVHAWLRNRPDSSEDMIPQNFATFSRYLRLARRYYDDLKVTPQADKEMGKSIVRAEQI